MVLNYKITDAMLDITDRKLHHVAPHLHGVLEMVYVAEGTLEIGVGTELYHMEEGDFAVVFPDLIHHYQVFQKGLIEVIMFKRQIQCVQLFLKLYQNCVRQIR